VHCLHRRDLTYPVATAPGTDLSDIVSLNH
jgi:hypothetical protein